MKGWKPATYPEKCAECNRTLSGHIRDIQAGYVKAHPFKVKRGKK